MTAVLDREPLAVLADSNRRRRRAFDEQAV
jgi:hypothetical protein